MYPYNLAEQVVSISRRPFVSWDELRVADSRVKRRVEQRGNANSIKGSRLVHNEIAFSNRSMSNFASRHVHSRCYSLSQSRARWSTQSHTSYLIA